MVDLHCHILPQIDDGAADMDQSIRMAKMAAEDGIHTIVATPHYRTDWYTPDPDRIQRMVDELNRYLVSMDIPVTILPGMEPRLHHEFLDHIQLRKILPIGFQRRYFFVELPFSQYVSQLPSFLYDLQLAGHTPVIAHPERYRYFQEHPELLFNLVKKGALTQVNGGSILGQFGKRTMKFAIALVQSGLIHLVASDAHDEARRPPLLSMAYRKIARYGGRRLSYQLKQNAEAVVAGNDFCPAEPGRLSKRFFPMPGYYRV